MMELNLLTEVVRERTDFWNSGSTTEATQLRASGDRSKIAIVAGDISSGPVFAYDAGSDTFSSEKDLNAFIDYVGTDRTGSVYLVDPGTFVLDAGRSLSGTISGGEYGVAVDPSGQVGYRVGAGTVETLDLNHFSVTGSIALGDTVNSGTYGRGDLAINHSGTALAAVTDGGLSVVQVMPVVQPTPTPTPRPHPHPDPDADPSGAAMRCGR